MTVGLACMNLLCLIPAILFGAVLFSIKDIDNSVVQATIGIVAMVLMSFFVLIIVMSMLFWIREGIS